MFSQPKPEPSYAPVYAAMYAELAVFFRLRGYALAIHGSLRRDFDLIAVPWVESPISPDVVLAALQEEFAIKAVGEPTDKGHGRTAYSISVGWGS